MPCMCRQLVHLLTRQAGWSSCSAAPRRTSCVPVLTCPGVCVTHVILASNIQITPRFPTFENYKGGARFHKLEIIVCQITILMNNLLHVQARRLFI